MPSTSANPVNDGFSLVWYVSYGSNLRSARLDRHLKGGTPQGGLCSPPGARGTWTPEQVAALVPGPSTVATGPAGA